MKIRLFHIPRIYPTGKPVIYMYFATVPETGVRSSTSDMIVFAEYVSLAFPTVLSVYQWRTCHRDVYGNRNWLRRVR